MYIGFDYGTSNCSIAHMLDGQPTPIAVEGDNIYIPSTVSAPTRESVTEHLFRFCNIKPIDQVGESLLRRAIAFNQDEGIELDRRDINFGQAALDHYLQDPQFTYYVKSPKSFLGSMGLRDIQVQFFEDLVCAMMVNIKSQGENQLGQSIDETVIGRPIHFQGRGGNDSDQQAEAILLRAATRAGFKNVEFQFEPVAAGLEYEASLTEDKLVLVVDIGGGTTDCSLLQMGPNWAGKNDRSDSLIAHSGERVGGNDLDIHVAFRQLMPAFGFGSKMVSGLEMPITQFWNPVAINDLPAQTDFYTKENFKALKQLHKDAKDPAKLARLIELHQEILGHGVVRRAEEAKIGLSKQDVFTSTLDFLSHAVDVDINRNDMMEAIESPKTKMMRLVQDALAQGGRKPDVVYMTGGSAKSPILRQAVEEILPGIPLVSGNDFGSVTAGLARWAEVCFR
ncbi:molecular chaperone [Vibrio sp. CAIM 722]|uniref:Molecular chaperone n=1 Tax=Vibrio eleionomae TaxID=2653505 RepID=A0A7X4LLY7_9VIBR|nr:molecular chaperone [Vibrio eleionomae]MZI94410.1 molecular chaperone [Vibrio eleionomae]